MNKLLKLIIMTLIIVSISACDDDDDPKVVVVDPPAPLGTVVDVAVANGSFTTLVAALQATGLDATLSDSSTQFTVFAPTDDAFALLGQATIDALLADTDTLSDILTYHVIAGKVDAAAAVGAAGTTVAMVNGDSIGLSLDGTNLLVNTATVTITDVMADNGIIHVIDAVLIPPKDKGDDVTKNIVETAIDAGSFTTLVAALQAADLDATLADETASFTVFAPTDDAFAAIGQETIELLLADTELLKSILLQHVVAGEVNSVTAFTLNGGEAETASGAKIGISINSDNDMLMFGGAKITMTDVYASNGVIHVIDAVVTGDVTIPEPLGSIADVAVAAGSFTTLVTALGATGLDAVLDDKTQNYTVFAPTDAAFDLLPEGTVTSLLADPETLKNILLYHVIAGDPIMADAAIQVASGADSKVTMANNAMTALSLSGNDLYINQSKVSTPNVAADNGVIHVIDQVILPPAMMDTPTKNIVETALDNPNFSTLVTALQAANLVDALNDNDKKFTVFAPTNAAFDKIDDAALAGLLANTGALTSVLLQHVVADAEINSIAAFNANGSSVNTMANDDVTVRLVNFTNSTNEAADEVAYDAMKQMLVGGQNSSKAGFTLYVFDDDLGQSSSVCVDTCATNWPPVLVSDDDVSNVPGLSVITRADNSKQAAFMGRPLYFYVGDMQAGDMTGDGAGGKWWKVSQPQVSLQIQGSNVVTTDIYTTNGIIHVIDTVITETLN